MDITYSIKDLERLSGIKAHTLRIWEQRYQLLLPLRNEGNIRSYTDEDLRLLLNISLLYNQGIKISKIALLNKNQIEEQVKEILNFNDSTSNQINSLIISMIDFKENQFDLLLNDNIKQIGFKDTIENLLFPFLRRIGYMWQTGTIYPAHEHFISNLIRQKLISYVANHDFKLKKDALTFVLFLPELELHEISLLYFNYIIKEAGHKVIYLGQSVPISDLKKVCDIQNPAAIVTIITQPFAEGQLQKYLDNLYCSFKIIKNTKILVSGMQIFCNTDLNIPASMTIVKDYNDLEMKIKQL